MGMVILKKIYNFFWLEKICDTPCYFQLIFGRILWFIKVNVMNN